MQGMADGAGSKGTWKLTGGTRKFANAKGAAQWEFSRLQGKRAAVRWVGNCQWRLNGLSALVISPLVQSVSTENKRFAPTA